MKCGNMLKIPPENQQMELANNYWKIKQKWSMGE
jgi:hypothetical protein